MIMVWNTQDLVDTANESPCVPMAKIDNAQDMGVFSLDVNKHITFDMKNKTSTVSEMALELFDVYDGHTSSVTCVRYSHNGEYLVSTSVDKLVKVWDNEGNCVASLDGHNRYVNCATISKDLSIIASGKYNMLKNVSMMFKISDKLVRMFKISKENNAEEHCFSPLEGHTYAINHVEFSSNGNTLASCSQDGCAILWDAATGEKIRSLPKNILSLKVCRFCPDNTLLLTAGDDEKAILWNSETMEKLAQFEGHLDTISGACVSPDGLISVTVSVNADYRIWSLESFACLYIKEDAHDYGIQDCDMSHNLEPIPNLTINAQSYLLVTCGNDSLVKLWRISLPNKCDTSIDKIEVKLWRSLQGHGGNVLCVRFSQIVSEFVCSTATDRQARIWSVYSANCLYVLDHDSIVTSCYFNVDCSLLATGCLDKTLWLWKLPQHLMFQSAVADKIQSRAKPIIDWTTADIIKWLKNIEMHGLIPVATNCCLDGKKLITLTVDQICALLDLDESEQEKFQKEIRWLKNREIKLEAANTLDIPDEFLCPITHEIMSEPVMCSDGFTYEKNAITEWFMSGKYTSPMTNEVLSNTDVTRNIKLRNEIYEFLDMNEEDV
ncbi:unnamed protein product [Diabrotica balteata]|uniref:U-box domain-containing protein n=1 Tax=Diabrotica balteata TaxID=107213 RepID=A0A9N9TB59_DIABA|nr:unnamed protein product [Diabrotica balteata]